MLQYFTIAAAASAAAAATAAAAAAAAAASAAAAAAAAVSSTAFVAAAAVAISHITSEDRLRFKRSFHWSEFISHKRNTPPCVALTYTSRHKAAMITPEVSK